MTTTRDQAPVQMSAAVDAPEKKPLLCLSIEVEDGSESFRVARDVRHGKEGFRVLRYVVGETVDEWDECYQFYTSLNDLYAAIESGDYTKGQRAF